MIKLYDNNISSLRQSAKQRQSSLIAEQKWSKRNPLTENYNLKQNSEYSTNVMLNRKLMKTANFNNENTLKDYVLTVYEIPAQHKMYG
mgnify:CR=1 FL=1|tara:strand:+ start:177 stop:440 length:264 start_codon:yes stop_codon:yes gene_type:complete